MCPELDKYSRFASFGYPESEGTCPHQSLYLSTSFGVQGGGRMSDVDSG